MSTRKTIFYENGVHVFEEQLSREICIEAEGLHSFDDGAKRSKTNRKYDSNILSVKQAQELVDSLSKYLKDRR